MHLIPRSIRERIIALLLALALPLVAIVAVALVREYRTSAERAEGAAVELAVAMMNAVQQVLDGAHSVVASLARDPAIRALDAPACAPWLREVTGMMPQFANIIVADTAGTVVCSAHPMETRISLADRAWFGMLRRTMSPVTGRYQVGNITGRPVVPVAHPLVSADGAFVGVVAAGLDIGHFQQLVEGLPQPPGAVVTLADDAWTVLARSTDPERWIGQTLPGDTVPETAVTAEAGLMKATGFDGITRVFGFANVQGPGWRVYAGVPESWIYGPVRAAAVRRGAAVAAVLLAVAVLAVLLFRRVAESLSALVDGTRRAAQGVGARVPEVGPTEVVAVARQFNTTLAARDRAEAELRRARERYASVLHNAPYGIFVSRVDGQLIDVNPALVRMLGYASQGALRAATAQQIFADACVFDELLRRAVAGERLQGEEVEWRRHDGGRVLASLSCGVTVTADGERILEVIAEDVTERRALEEHLLETRKMEAVGRLAGGVAHDFNNLLTIVRGQAQFLLLEVGEEAAEAEHAREIIHATDRGARLTRQLMAFGRRQLVQPVPLDLNETIRSLRTMLRHVLGDDIVLRMRLGNGLPPASADPGQVEQIVLNLVFNARDATTDGGKVTIETGAVRLSEADCRGRRGARPGDFLQLSVTDTGEGIPSTLIDRVFEPFFTTKPQGRGTGLGLATVYGNVSQSGGWIEVRSEPGRGARFTVYLPQATEPAAPPDEAPADRHTPVRGTILLAEDEDAVRRVVAIALRKRGYEVLEADSGDAALRVADAHAGPLDLLLTDEMMPGMRGTQLASELLARRAGLRVLFMSGYTDRVPDGSTYDGAPSAFIAKPFSHEQLLQLVATLLRREPAAAERGSS